MKSGLEIRVGNVINVDGKPCKVLTQEIRGSGKVSKHAHCKLKDLNTGHIIEKSFRGDEKVDELDLEHVKMQYSYKDGEQFVFMNVENYEQFFLPVGAVGKQEAFLTENMEIDVEFVEGKPVSVVFPKTAELKVTNCPPATKGGNDSTFKEAEVENGLMVLVPQFVKEGDIVKIDVESLEYLERLTKKSLKPRDDSDSSNDSN